MKKAIAIASLLAAATCLTGCSALTDLAHSESESHFDDVSAFSGTSSQASSASWIPADASDISVRESSDHAVAILGFTTGSPLDPTECAETERLSAPSFTDDWAPSDVFVDSVFACGEWAVMTTDDGFFAWTPSAPGEREAAP